MNRPTCPCDACKRKPHCPNTCYPRKDWLRALDKMHKERRAPWATRTT